MAKIKLWINLGIDLYSKIRIKLEIKLKTKLWINLGIELYSKTRNILEI